MKRILFVDDEPKILQALKRMLHSRSKEWEMSFAESGAQALAMMEKTPFDVVVSDMRMPEMDGATLLEKVRTLYPQVIRIVLSGHAEQETILRAIPIAHQFLSKPCDSNLLANVIERTCKLQSMLAQDAVRALVHQVRELPSPPRIYHELTQALLNPQISPKEIGQIMEQDIAMSAKVLQLVNSAFFSLPRRISNVMTAVTCIGTNMLKNLILTVELFRMFETQNAAHLSLINEIQSHALLTAKLAKSMFSQQHQEEDAFIVGMLHDIGLLILLAYFPEQFSQVSKNASASQKELHEVELELLGTTHAEIGAYLLGLWGLPYPIIEAVANHHQPQRVQNIEFDILSAVYVADYLVNSLNNTKAELDLNYLSRLSVLDRVPEWKAKLALFTAQGIS